MEVIFTDRFLDRVEEFSDHIALDNIPKAVTWAEEILTVAGNYKPTLTTDEWCQNSDGRRSENSSMVIIG